jgi:hypothetical protein
MRALRRLRVMNAHACLSTLLLDLCVTGCAGTVVSTSPSTSMQADSVRDLTTLFQLPERRATSGSFIYVANVGELTPPFVGSILIYPVGSNGNVAPAAVIAGSNTRLTWTQGIVVDSTGNIYVANADTNTIVIFGKGSSGNVAPSATISGSNTGLASPNGLAIDAANNIYVANCGTGCNYGPPGPASIEEFAAGSTGNVAPIRTISGSKARFSQHMNGIARDSRGFLYVAFAGPNTVNGFAPNKSGDVKPRQFLSGPETLLNSPSGIAVDDNGIYVADTVPYIERFPRHANGNVGPAAVLQTPSAPNGQSIGGIFAAPDGTIYVAGCANPTVSQYAPRAKRHAHPLTVVQGPATQLVVPSIVFVR